MLEYIVRPFQSAPPQNTTLIPATRGSSSAKASLAWGDVGTLPTPATLSTVVKDGTNTQTKKKLVETTRQSSTIKITNPNDPTQFVMVQRPSEISFTETDTKATSSPSMEQVAYAPPPATTTAGATATTTDDSQATKTPVEMDLANATSDGATSDGGTS